MRKLIVAFAAVGMMTLTSCHCFCGVEDCKSNDHIHEGYVSECPSDCIKACCAK